MIKLELTSRKSVIHAKSFVRPLLPVPFMEVILASFNLLRLFA